jgi:radical SAM protein with 4Fe4S-binding SPASM domain
MIDCDLHSAGGATGYFKAIVDKGKQERAPMSGALDLTYRCNFRCVHCYVGHLVARPASASGELETNVLKRYLEDAAAAGCYTLLLSGGEPLLRDDFTEIYMTARRLGMFVTVFTNASLLTPAHIAVFREYPPRMVEVSVYGASEATYQRVTGVAGGFERTWKGIDMLVQGGIRLGLKTMILQENVHEIPAIEARARELGVGFRMDPLITPRLDGDKAPLDSRVDPKLAAHLELNDEQRRSRLATFLQTHPVDLTEGASDRLYRCGAGIGSFHIDPQGFLHPCLMSQSMRYSIEQLGFLGAWHSVVKAVEQARWDESGACTQCPLVLFCGYCAGLFELEGATPSKPPGYLCRLGEARRAFVRSLTMEVHDVRRTQAVHT